MSIIWAKPLNREKKKYKRNVSGVLKESKESVNMCIKRLKVKCEEGGQLQSIEIIWINKMANVFF